MCTCVYRKVYTNKQKHNIKYTISFIRHYIFFAKAKEKETAQNYYYTLGAVSKTGWDIAKRYSKCIVHYI